MNPSLKAALHSAHVVGLAALLGGAPPAAQAQTLNFANTPLFLGSTVKPNVLVVYDNSQSMDGTMAGKLIAGDDPSTRGNIARDVLRSTITTYRSQFQWGLASFKLGSGGLYTTYPYYFGTDTEVVYTNTCAGGVSNVQSSAGLPLRCVANPQTGNGFNFITYARTGDDPDINDVLYTSDKGTQMYGIGQNNSTAYTGFLGHGNNSGWSAGSFTGGSFGLRFTPTDAGFLPGTYPGTSNYYPRIFWLRRAWGYNNNITGAGVVNEPVAADSASHYSSLMTLLAAETNGGAGGELKNAAVYTPLAGTLTTARDYFANTLGGTTSPISQSCQKNFVLLATDGNPTGNTAGDMYALADISNIYNPATRTWTFGTASNDVFSRVTALRSTAFGGRNYDVQTYVVGLGNSVANASSIATLDRMAALGGTVDAYQATDATALADAFRAISVDIISRTAAASSVSLNSGAWSTGTKVYQGRFSSAEWSGQLLALPLSSTGAPSASADWDAGQVLKTQHWSSGRQILTYKPSAALGARGVPFRWPSNVAAPGTGELDAGLSTALNKNSAGTVDGYGAQRLDYLRGNTAREDRLCANCSAPVFRGRSSTVLGDIVNSAPAYVGGPTGDFRDTMEAGRYSSYAGTRRAQAPVLYVGANDGMLHAFAASNGAELFAYVPWAVRNKLSNLTNTPYTHQFTVDGTPSVGDVYYGSGWKSLLVSGMNAGAAGLFALDVTAPTNFTEANAAQVVRWEIGDSDADVGYIFGRPLLVKARDGRWRAIVGNGYNSANGHAVLLLVDAETGAITRIDTKVGTAGTPNGLSGVAVVSGSDTGVADFVYAGDLYGNLWKFDISAASPSSWKVAYGTSAVPLPMFTAANGQAITARPDVTRFPKGGYMVTVGSGRYVDISDNAAGSTQALYGIWDNGSSPAAIANLQTQAIVGTAAGGNGNTYRLSTHAVGPATDATIAGDNAISLADYYTTKRGWKLNLPSSGERVVTEAAVRNGRVIVSTLIPSTATCSYGGDGWVVDVDVTTGNRTDALDTNGDNLIDASDYLGGVAVSAVQVGSVPAAATILRGSGDQKALEYKMVNTSNGSILRVQEKGKASPTSRRAAWEQLQ